MISVCRLTAVESIEDLSTGSSVAVAVALHVYVTSVIICICSNVSFCACAEVTKITHLYCVSDILGKISDYSSKNIVLKSDNF